MELCQCYVYLEHRCHCHECGPFYLMEVVWLWSLLNVANSIWLQNSSSQIWNNEQNKYISQYMDECNGETPLFWHFNLVLDPRSGVNIFIVLRKREITLLFDANTMGVWKLERWILFSYLWDSGYVHNAFVHGSGHGIKPYIPKVEGALICKFFIGASRHSFLGRVFVLPIGCSMCPITQLWCHCSVFRTHLLIWAHVERESWLCYN